MNRQSRIDISTFHNCVHHERGKVDTTSVRCKEVGHNGQVSRRRQEYNGPSIVAQVVGQSQVLGNNGAKRRSVRRSGAEHHDAVTQQRLECTALRRAERKDDAQASDNAFASLRRQRAEPARERLHGALTCDDDCVDGVVARRKVRVAAALAQRTLEHGETTATRERCATSCLLQRVAFHFRSNTNQKNVCNSQPANVLSIRVPQRSARTRTERKRRLSNVFFCSRANFV